MFLVWRYSNPVAISFGVGAFAELPKLIGSKPYALVTYPDAPFSALAGRLRDIAGSPVLTIDDVAPNPDTKLLAQQSARFSAAAPETIVALGGGSVIDTAKVLAAGRQGFPNVLRYLQTGAGAEALSAIRIIAVPTTAGTGSEVTSWATVWDTQSGKKYSLSRPNLYPTDAVIDPGLMTGKPRQLTISTGLDALSHALESLWNVNVNPVSAQHAVTAAREILAVLPMLISDLQNVTLRSRMAAAALSAGLAFSNTRTAIAHSISYPVTLHHNVVHGIACSFTLPMILRSIAGGGGLTGEGLTQIFGTNFQAGADRLTEFLASLGVSTDFRTYGIEPGAWSGLIADAFDGERGQNFIGTRQALLQVAGLREYASAKMH